MEPLTKTFEVANSFCSEIRTMDLLLQVIEQSGLSKDETRRVLEWFRGRVDYDMAKNND